MVRLIYIKIIKSNPANDGFQAIMGGSSMKLSNDSKTERTVPMKANRAITLQIAVMRPRLDLLIDHDTGRLKVEIGIMFASPLTPSLPYTRL